MRKWTTVSLAVVVIVGVVLCCMGPQNGPTVLPKAAPTPPAFTAAEPSWQLQVVPSKGWTGPGQVVPLDGTELITPWPNEWIVLRLTVGENMHWWEVRVLDEIRWSGTGPDVGTFELVVLKIPGDVNGDKFRNLIDAALVKSMNGADPAAPGNARFDLNADGYINLIDMALCKSLGG